MANVIIIDGREVPVPGVEIRTWRETGLEFPLSPPRVFRSAFSRGRQQVKMFVLHWTAGERDERGLHQTLINRGLGVHFFCRKDGVIFQFTDLSIATEHAEISRASVGMEIQNAGFPRNGGQATYGRDVYRDTINDRNAQMLDFTPEQKNAIKKVCSVVCREYGIPYTVPSEGGQLIKRVLTSQERNFRGIIGHYHISNVGKRDPGTKILEEILQEGAPPTDTAQPPAQSQQQAQTVDNIVAERLQSLTHNRTDTPSNQYGYYVVGSGSSAREIDRQSAFIIDASAIGNSIVAPFQEFYNQMVSLKVSSLDLTRAVPVLQIFARDERNNVVNLNELIFSKPTFENYNQPVAGFDFYQERPVASLENFTITIQSPSAGGATGIAVGNLSIKVHNPYTISDEHPTGKFISYMMRQGYYLRIRFGVQGNTLSEGEAFKWIEDDFFTAQHEIDVDDNNTMSLKITMIPAASKLFNQVFIGQSIPATAISQQDVVNATEAAIANDASPQERNQVKNNLSRLSRSFNSRLRSAGIRTEITGDNTLRSVLQGTLTNDELLRNIQGPVPAHIESTIEGVKTLQAILLTKRYEEIIGRDAYQYTNKGITIPVVNIGALFYNLVLPEIQYITEVVSRTGLSIGSTSSEANRNRNKVKLVFGNFNARAGSWANKAVSSFPVNLDELFSYIRQNRDIGSFSDTINNFISRISTIIDDPANFIIEQNQNMRIETPNLKYNFYPDPTSNDYWIFYVYDQKEQIVNFSLVLESTRDEDLTADQIKQICEDHNIPWIQTGDQNSLIKSLKGSTAGDDMIQTNNMFMANQLAFNNRNVDNLPPGVNREFIGGIQIDQQDIVRSTTLIMPLKLNITYFCIVSAVFLGGVYVFFPVNQFSGLYNIQSLSHEIQNGDARTNLELMINISGRNRIPNRPPTSS